MPPFSEGKKQGATIEQVVPRTEQPAPSQNASFENVQVNLDQETQQAKARIEGLKSAWSDETIPNELLIQSAEEDFDNSDDEVDLGMAERMKTVEAEHYKLTPVDRLRTARAELAHQQEQELKMGNAFRLAEQRAQQIQQEIREKQREAEEISLRQKRAEGEILHRLGNVNQGRIDQLAREKAFQEQRIALLEGELQKQSAIVDQYRGVLQEAAQRRLAAHQDVRTLREISPEADEQEEVSAESSLAMEKTSVQAELNALAFQEAEADAEVQRLQEDIEEAERRESVEYSNQTPELVDLGMALEAKKDRLRAMENGLTRLDGLREKARSGLGRFFNRAQIAIIEKQKQDQQAEITRLKEEISNDQVHFSNEMIAQQRKAGPWIVDRQKADEAFAKAWEKKQELVNKQQKLREKLEALQ
jgi:hypothetical protein